MTKERYRLGGQIRYRGKGGEAVEEIVNLYTPALDEACQQFVEVIDELRQQEKDGLLTKAECIEKSIAAAVVGYLLKFRDEDVDWKKHFGGALQ